ncbi:MAG: GNAT family N-acetyltransferase [Verrucomicrobia bacterium]|nr:GNAT family N-acetyltransferase [Verrucomicrobiota bacterium]
MNVTPRPVSMVRVSREPFPIFALPSEFSFAWYRPGCEAWWHDIQHRADKLTPITSELFHQSFGEASAELPRRQCFLLDVNGQPIGTATAWLGLRQNGEVWGRLHWVAIVPEFQRRGLAKPLLSVVCERMRALHPERSFLRTAAERPAAIRLYLKFGFVPEMRTDAERELWSAILARIDQDQGKGTGALGEV